MEFTQEQLSRLNLDAIKRGQSSTSKSEAVDYSKDKKNLSKNIVQFRNGFVNLPNSDEDNLQMAMSVVSELMNFGYIMTPDCISELSKASKKDIEAFYNEVIDYTKKMIGADMEYTPFWPNFPTSVMKRSEVELWMHQIIHYMSHGSYIPNELTKKASTAFEQGNYTTLNHGNDSDFLDIFTNLVSVNGSLTPDDKEVVEWFVENVENINMPESIPFKETLCLLASLGVDCKIQTVTDVLRVATYMSGGDITLKKNTKRNTSLFKKFKRSERKLILSLLEQTSCDASEAVLKYSKWIRLGEILHPGEYRNKFPKSFEMFKKLRNEKVVSWYSSVQKAFDKDLDSGLNKLAERPGEFFRRIDSLIRKNSNQITKVLSHMSKVGTKVSNKVLFETYEHFEKRDVARSIRSITLPGARSNVILKSLDPLSRITTHKVKEHIKYALRAKFQKLPKMSNVWVDEDLKRIPMPKNMRSLSSSLTPTIRGQRTALKNKDAKVVRAFVHWFDENGTEDLDLTALFVGWTEITHIGWNGVKNNHLGCYSGDVRNKVGPCAEYVDINIDAALKSGYKYVIMDVRNYNRKGFHTMQQCVGGCMERENAVPGEVFLPKTLTGTMKLQSESSSGVIMFVFDLESREYIHLDVDSSGNVLSHNVQEMMNQIREYCEPPKFSVYDLVMMHVESRGGKLVSKENADVSFCYNEFVSSYAETLKLMGV